VIPAPFLIIRSQYDAWKEIYRELIEEKAKNEAEPHMDIRVHNVVPYSHDGTTATDLFFYVELVLERPRQVSVENFSVSISDQGQSVASSAVEDVMDWQWIRRGTFADGIVDCEPLRKELSKRGDPVRGWIHFPMPKDTPEIIDSSSLTLNISCTFGTCYTGVDPRRSLQTDPETKGLVWKRPKIVYEKQ
jgi:hypothetical protein